jgi:hypothetical protein
MRIFTNDGFTDDGFTDDVKFMPYR